MQSITVPEIDGCHTNPTAPLITLVVFTDSLAPEVTGFSRAFILSKPNFNEEVTVGKVWLEVWGGLSGCPLIDVGGEEVRSIPAVKLSSVFRFKIKRSAQGDNSSNLDRQYVSIRVLSVDRHQPTFSGRINAIRTVIQPP